MHHLFSQRQKSSFFILAESLNDYIIASIMKYYPVCKKMKTKIITNLFNEYPVVEILFGYNFYAPIFEEVEGAYWFGSVRLCSEVLAVRE